MRLSFLICLFAAWPLAVASHAAEPGPPDLDDPLQRWFKEQDKLLDDILVRLGRIENRVNEIHRLIAQLPDRMQVAAAPAKPVPLPGPSSPPAPPPEPGFDPIAWLPLAAGGIAVVLLALWWSRRRQAAPAVQSAQPAAKPAAAAPVQTPTPKLAPSASVKPAPSSVQTAGASQINGQPDQAIELAEIMLSMGLGHGAAQTLAEQIRNEPKQGLRQWLKLLEIYRRIGQQAEFEQSSEELRQHFNVQAEDWNTPSGNQRSIEDYPHIAARIVELWSKPSCLSYLQNLLDDNRGGARSGFPQAVAEDILLLTALLKDRLKAGD